MKKIVTVLACLMVALSLTAGSAYNGDGKMDANASTQLSFSLSPEEVNSYSFGFTADSAWRPSEEPEPLGKIPLTLNQDKKSASSKGFAKIYYVVNANELPTLTLTAGKGLSMEKSSKTIPYELVVAGTSGSVTVRSGEDGKPLPLAPLNGKGYSAGTFSLDINTDKVITPDMANKEHDWTDEIVLSISVK